jgi:hypothetical protein
MEALYVTAGVIAENGPACVLMTEAFFTPGVCKTTAYRGLVLIDRHSRPRH